MQALAAIGTMGRLVATIAGNWALTPLDFGVLSQSSRYLLPRDLHGGLVRRRHRAAR